MTKYICVKGPPTGTLSKEEFVIRTPDFLAEVRECKYPLPNTKMLSHLYLRSIADHIGYKFDPNFPGSEKFVVNDFSGIPFSSDVEVAKHVVRMFQRFYPQIFDAYIDSKIKSLPFGIKLIYFVGDHLQTSSFAKNGVEAIDDKDVSQFLGKKATKNKKTEVETTE